MVRADKKTNIAKVVKAKLKNPLATRDKIAKLAWVSQWTTSNVLSELDKTWRKDDRIVWITDKDLEIVNLWQAEIYRRLWNAEELKNMRTVEISQVIRENTARYNLFRWTATDSQWWLKDSIIIKLPE